MDADKRVAEGKAQRKVSHSNEYAKTVLTRNAGERLCLAKMTKHLNKEKTAKEAQLNHAQRLLLRRYGMQRDSDYVLETTSDACARKSSLVSIKQKSPLHLDTREHGSRLRSSSWGPSGTAANSFDNMEERFSAVSIGARNCEKLDTENNKRESLYSKANFSPKLSSKRTQLGKTRPVINLESCESPKEENEKSLGSGLGNIEGSVTGKNISEILPPFALPPIYTAVPTHSTSQHNRRRKRSKQMEHRRLCVSISDPGRQKPQIRSSRSHRKEADVRDLSECRYLRSNVNK